MSKSWNKQGVLTFEADYLIGERHGRFNKYYDDGAPYIEQNFAYDQPEGVKKKYDREGHVTISHFEEGKSVR